jgi:hypothetical protein
MAKKQPKINKLPDETEIEVKMTKKMEFSEYLKMFQQAKNKGWKVEAFQIGFNK